MKRSVEVHYYVSGGRRDEFYREIKKRKIDESTRAEAGNERYEYYFNPENENELVLLEVWESADDVKLHMETSHYKELVELKNEFVVETVFRRSDICEL